MDLARPGTTPRSTTAHSTTAVLEPLTATPVAVDDPRPSRRFAVGLLASTVGNVVALYAPLALGLAVKVDSLVEPAQRVGVLSLVTGTGAVVALVANPLAGRLSDRSTSRFGRRRPWVAGGALLGLAGLAAVALAPGVAVLVLGWCLAQAGFGAVMAATVATLADQAGPTWRGRMSGVIGVSVPLGMAAGAFLASLFTGGDPAVVLVPAALGTALVLLFCLLLRDPPVTTPPPRFDLREFAGSFVFDPRRNPDFGWVWVTKFLFMCAYAAGTTYTAYFLLEVLHLGGADVGRVVVLALVAVMAGNLLTSPLGGWLSDRFRVRRPFVAVAAAVAMAGLVVTGLSSDVPALLAGQFVLGLGMGCFNAVDLALATDTLPRDGSAAKDLGVFNVAAALPQAVVPALGFSLITAFGFRSIYLVGAALGLLGALLVHRVRSVR